MESNKQLMKELKVEKSVPEGIFNNVVFTIGNNEQNRKKTSFKWFAILSPIATSVLVGVLFLNISISNSSQAIKDGEFLANTVTAEYYDGYFISIDEDFVY